MRQLSHSTLSNLGTISLKSGTLRAKMSYSWGGSIKRPDLQTAYGYRTESFSVDSNMIGRSTWAVARSDLMRVSHSWIPKVSILEILKHFWPASEPCRQATIMIWTLCFLCLPCPPPLPSDRCKYEGMDMHNLATVLCQIWGQFRWNLVLYESKCPILKGVHQTARSPNCVIDTGLNHSASIPIWSGDHTCAVTRSDLKRVSHSWTPKLNILEILKHFWPASEPCRQATITDMVFMIPVPALPSLT